jgi:hypothetical protein
MADGQRISFGLWRPADREKAVVMVRNAPPGSVFELSDPARTIPQNQRLHALISEAVKRGRLIGRDYTTDQWKALFLHASGFTTEFLPALEGGGFVPYRPSTAVMKKAQVTELMDFIEEWIDQNLPPLKPQTQQGNFS